MSNLTDTSPAMDRLRQVGLSIGLETMADIFQYWLTFERDNRAREKLETTPDTHIIVPTHWPTHGAVTNWVAMLREAIEDFARHDARVTELLQANNREVDRRRIAEHMVAALLTPLRTARDFIREVHDDLLRNSCVIDKATGEPDRSTMRGADAEEVAAIAHVLLGVDQTLSLAQRGYSHPNERPTTPVAILCAEIGVPFLPEMETVETFSLFLGALAAALQSDIETRQAIAQHFSRPFDTANLDILKSIAASLAAGGTAEEMVAYAQRMLDADDLSERHDEQAHADHDFEGIIAIVVALRFGLETPCQSRHAAHAGGQIFERLYGLKRHDRHTAAFAKRWMAVLFMDALADRERATA